ncbi:MAG: triose-phosphate isomerase [Planctomycetaceae bacterium]|nr:triose-phosphate isomerase [Planctomycetaceae bacterium]
MRPPLIAGNWKMNGSLKEARDLASGLRQALGDNAGGPDVLVCPPFLALESVRQVLEGGPIKLGAQDVHWEAKGAFTGELSTSMLKEVGVSAVLLGHSERRHVMGETNEMINKKAKACLAAGLLPILCIGELLEERNMGVTREVVERQISKGLEGLTPEDVAKCVLAYEPVWAIGTGKTATPRQAEEVHHYVRKLITQKSGEAVGQGIRILYGGSVSPDNVKELMSEEDIDGALVGGASLKVDSFLKIVRYKS